MIIIVVTAWMILFSFSQLFTFFVYLFALNDTINSLNSSLKSHRRELTFISVVICHILCLCTYYFGFLICFIPCDSMSFHITYLHLYKHIWSELWHSFRSMHSLLMQQTIYANEAWVEKRHFNKMMIIKLLSNLYLILVFWRTNTHICECMRI